MSPNPLDFLSPDLAAPGAAWASPLARALAHAPDGIEDLSRTGVLDVRGDVSGLEAHTAEVVRLTPTRALVLCDYDDARRLRDRLAGAGRLVVDVSAGWAGLRLRGETALRRLTDLDPDALPAVGAVAHVRALVLRDDADTFRIFAAQELAHSLAEAVLDAAAGVTR